MNVFGYLRVSGKSQIDGDGFDRQRDTITAYCNAKGWKIIRWFQDGAVSGDVDAADRAGFMAMLEFASDKTAMVIVVERADRLARDLMVSEIACEEARKSHIQIFDACGDQELTDSSDPTRVLIRQVLGALAQWNKNVLVKRLRVARERIRLRDGQCEGKRAFGYRGNDEEFAVVKDIVRLRDEEKMSWNKIAAWLGSYQRIPPEWSGDELGRPSWSTGTIHNIYDREKKRRSVVRTDSAVLAGLGIVD